MGEVIKDAITIGIAVKVFTEPEHVQLKVCEPVVRDFESPFPFGSVGRSGVDTKTVT